MCGNERSPGCTAISQSHRVWLSATCVAQCSTEHCIAVQHEAGIFILVAHHLVNRHIKTCELWSTPILQIHPK